MDGWMDGQVNGQMDEWLAGWMDGWVDGQMNRWMDGWSFPRPHISEVCAQDIAQLSSLDLFPQKIGQGA